MARIEPKHVAGINNVKYTINPNNNYWVVLMYLAINIPILLFNNKTGMSHLKITILSTFSIYVIFRGSYFGILGLSISGI